MLYLLVGGMVLIALGALYNVVTRVHASASPRRRARPRVVDDQNHAWMFVASPDHGAHGSTHSGEHADHGRDDDADGGSSDASDGGGGDAGGGDGGGGDGGGGGGD